MRKLLLGILFITNFAFASENTVRTIRVKVPLSFGTAKFEIHAKRKNINVAHLIEKILIEDSSKLLEYFKYIPRTTVHLMIDDLVDSANGAATVFPQNLIYLYNFPPTGDGHLSTSEDWWRILVLHELTHILHLDQTRGFPNFFRNIFGSVGKWNGITPRWFAEGIAVWAESEFTQNGRLRSSEVELELRRVIEEGHCRSLDCLDEPRAFPKGQLAYWMGGRFMQWLEKEKPQTIKCLVEGNSNSLPFFYNDAFIECTGKDAKLKFTEFLVAIQEEVQVQRRDLPSEKTSLNEIGRVDWQNGRAQVGDKLFLTGVEATEEEKDRLWEVDMIAGSIEEYRLPQYVERLMPGPQKLFLMFKRGQYFVDKKHWGVWDTQQKKLSKLSFSDNVDYLYEIDQELWALSWINGRWFLKKSSNQKDFKTVFEFPEFTSFKNPELEKQKDEIILTAKTYDFKTYDLREYVFKKDQDGKITENVLYQSNVPFNIAGKCDGDYFSSEHQSHQVAYISEKYFMDARLPDSLQKIKSCEDYQKWGLKKLPLKKSATTDVPQEYSGDKDHFYPHPSHFLPHWWMVGASFSGRYNYYKAETSIADPRDDHTFGLSHTYYTNLKANAPDVTYTNHQGLAQDLDLYTSLGYSKDYYRSSFASFNESNEMRFASMSLAHRFYQFLNYPSLIVQKQNRVDYFSKRQQTLYGVSENFMVLPNKSDDFVGPMEWFGQLAKYDLDRYPDYKNFQTKMQLKFRPTWQSAVTLQGSYGKNYKKDFSSGVMYAGGGAQTSGGGGNIHEFYGLDYADAYGDEIATTRTQFSLMTNRSYNLYHLFFIFPFYLKEVSLFGGYETLHANQIVIDEKIISKTNLESIHGGLRLNSTLGYFVPINVEFILASLLGSEHNSTFLLQVVSGGF